MEQIRFVEHAYKLQHGHDDGSWVPMEEQEHHAPSDHDPERDWASRRIFKCTRCDETLTLTPGSEGGPPDEE